MDPMQQSAAPAEAAAPVRPITKEIGAFRVNGREREAVIEPHMLLVDVLREQLGLTGAKRACATGHCGACTVLVEGVPIRSCITLAITVREDSIRTVEGLASSDGTLHPLQQAFVDHAASQCGFCTPGMLMSATALLRSNSSPTRDEVALALKGNLCRCTGYVKIIDAVLDAADRAAKGAT